MRVSPAVATFVLAFAACTSSQERGGGGDTGGTVLIDIVGEPGNVTPPLVQDQQSAMIRDLVFDRLAEIGQNMQTVGDKNFAPRLARSWAWSTDSLSIAFSLDPRARWRS